jgi:hypothetical protein
MKYNLNAYELGKILKDRNSGTFDLHAYEIAKFIEAGAGSSPEDPILPIDGPMVFYPTADGSYSDPMFPGFYPV